MLETLARLGYASKAVVYAIVGMLAIMTALNRGGRVTDTSGALRVVLTQPFGRFLLIVVAVGLSGYGVWRLLDAFLDPDRDGTSAGGLVTRIGNAIRGILYGGLGLEAFRLLRGLSGSKGNEARLYSARVLDLPLGELLLGIVGAIVVVYGASQLLAGVRGTPDPKVDMSCIVSDWRGRIATISHFGIAVRGGLIATLGFFLVRAAWTRDPSEAAGQRESMLQLGGLIEGRWFLAIIAAGVIGYAVDQAVHAWCRRIHSPV